MRSRIPYPRLGVSPGTTRIADAKKVTLNYLRLVEKVNGRLSADDLDPTQTGLNLFAETLSYCCYSFFYDTGANIQFILPTAGQSAKIIGWALSEVNQFNSLSRALGQQTQYGWTSALNATLSNVTGGTTQSQIVRSARNRVDSSGTRGGLPDADVMHIVHGVQNAAYTNGQTMQVAISSSLPTNGGYLVYVFFKIGWVTSSA